MPFLSCADHHIYDQYRFNEPWDGPNNTQFFNRFYGFYSCSAYAEASHTAHYVCVTGGTLWPVPARTGEDDWEREAIGWPNPKGGGVLPRSGKAVLIVELTESDIPWTKPEDIGLTDLTLLLRDDSSGNQFSSRVRRILAVDAAGAGYILDAGRDVEEIRTILHREAAEVSGGR